MNNVIIFALVVVVFMYVLFTYRNNKVALFLQSARTLIFSYNMRQLMNGRYFKKIDFPEPIEPLYHRMLWSIKPLKIDVWFDGELLEALKEEQHLKEEQQKPNCYEREI